MQCANLRAVLGAQDAFNPASDTHVFRILRPGNQMAASPQPVQLPHQEQPPAQMAVTQPAPTATPVSSDDPLAHYPWATAFETAEGQIKSRYNMPQGTMLAPMVQLQPTLTTTKRKEAFAATIGPGTRFLNN